MGIPVTLTNAEWFLAACSGVMKTIQNYRRGATNKDGIDENRGWDATIEGECGEAALSKYFNLWWGGNHGNYKAVDVGGKYQAKTTGTDYLILRKRDPDAGNYVCLKGRAPSYEIQGWIDARTGKDPKYWCDKFNNGRPAFFIPFRDLYPMENIRDGLENYI